MTPSPERAAEALSAFIKKAVFTVGVTIHDLTQHEYHTAKAALEQVANPPRGEEPEAVTNMRDNYYSREHFPGIWETIQYIDAQQSRIAELDADLQRWQTLDMRNDIRIAEQQAEIKKLEEKLNFANTQARIARETGIEYQKLYDQEQAEIERLKKAINVQRNAVKTLDANRRESERIYEGLYNEEKRKEKRMETLESEIEANAILTAEIERLKDFSPNPLAQPLKDAVAEVKRLKEIRPIIQRALKQYRIEHCFDDSEFGIAIDAFLASSTEGCDG
jgi:chromosome segregation ATPase